MPQTQEGVEGPEGEPSQMAKRTAEWVQEGEEEQDEAKKARLEGDPGITAIFGWTQKAVVADLSGGLLPGLTGRAVCTGLLLLSFAYSN